jgi:hypothetical protein
MRELLFYLFFGTVSTGKYIHTQNRNVSFGRGPTAMQSPAVAATDAMQFISDVAADLFQAKTSSRPPPLRRSLSPVSEDLSVEELVQQCDVILTKLKGADASENIQQPTLPGGVRGAGALGLDVSTLGRGVIVRDMVPGGPAHCSKKLGRGDVIVAVDGVPVTPENWSRLAAGNGKPGSIATLTILKTESTGDIAPTAYKTLAAEVAKVAQVEVKLRRMARSDMSDNVSNKSLCAYAARGTMGSPSARMVLLICLVPVAYPAHCPLRSPALCALLQEIMFKLFDDATQELALSSAASARGRHAGRFGSAGYKGLDAACGVSGDYWLTCDSMQMQAKVVA